MPNILATGDIHFGLKSHSDQLPSGYTSAENDAIIALETIYNRATQSDIDLIIFAGDITHTNHPTSLVVSYLTEYFNKLSRLGKSIFIIPGNHDKSNYSYSFEFIDSANIENVTVVSSDFLKLKPFDDISLYFVPFVFGNELTNKYSTIQETIKSIIETDSSKKIIVSHFQESSSVAGSESTMISKSIEVMDAGSILGEYSNTMLLLGHIHFHQVYLKSNGIKVCYTGNPYPHDKTDSNQKKGYVIINTNTLDVVFEQIPGIRNFSKVAMTSDKNALEYFKSARIPKNTIFFIENEIKTVTDKVDIDEINELLKPFGSKAVELTNTLEEIKNLIKIDSITQVDFKVKFIEICEKNYKEDLSEEDFKLLLQLGLSRLEAGLL
jgi:DNA repair exonuclease SbcCD nuclease subunit